MSKFKNAIIFIVIAAVIFSVYFFFIRSDEGTETNLVSTPAAGLPDVGTGTAPREIGGTGVSTDNFLTLLLNVKNIKLEDSVLAETTFKNLKDTSILLTPDGTEGRVNPFARLGSDPIAPPTPIVPPATGTTGTPPAGTTSPTSGTTPPPSGTTGTPPPAGTTPPPSGTTGTPPPSSSSGQGGTPLSGNGGSGTGSAL